MRKLASIEHVSLDGVSAVDDATALFREYEDAGVQFAQPLQREAWGARTFIDRDPDGNLILFAGDDTGPLTT